MLLRLVNRGRSGIRYLTMAVVILAILCSCGCLPKPYTIKVERTPRASVTPGYSGTIAIVPLQGGGSRFLGKIGNFRYHEVFATEPIEVTLTGYLAEALRELGYIVTLNPLESSATRLIISGEMHEIKIYHNYVYIVSAFFFKNHEGKVLWAKDYNIYTSKKMFEEHSTVVQRAVDNLLMQITSDITSRFDLDKDGTPSLP